MKRVLAIAALPIVAACTPYQPKEPVIAAFNGDSVEIQLDGLYSFMDEPMQEQLISAAKAEADRMCRRGHGKQSEFVSVRAYNPRNAIAPDYYTALYVCLK